MTATQTASNTTRLEQLISELLSICKDPDEALEVIRSILNKNKEG